MTINQQVYAKLFGTAPGFYAGDIDQISSLILKDEEKKSELQEKLEKEEIEQGIIRLEGPVCDKMAKDFEQKITHIYKGFAEDKPNPMRPRKEDKNFLKIQLEIDSPGGSVYAMFRILEAMKSIPRYDSATGKRVAIATHTNGLAASAALSILMSGDPQFRSAGKSARLMMHDMKSFIMYGVFDHHDWRESIDKFIDTRKKFFEHAMVHTGMTKEAIDSIVERDRWLDAAKGVELGIVDYVIDPTLLSTYDPEVKAMNEAVIALKRREYNDGEIDYPKGAKSIMDIEPTSLHKTPEGFVAPELPALPEFTDMQISHELIENLAADKAK